ncbi:hypothetical protein BH23PAT1_BH23PAT1_3280 [soil metagenome]
MKNVTKLMISAALMAPVIVVGSLGAIAREDGTSYPEARPGEMQVMTAQEEGQDTEINSEAKMLERLEQRRAARNLRLTFAEQQRIRSVCKPSQGKLQSLKGRITGLETSRTERYGNLVNRLERASDKLQEKDVDTGQLDAQVSELKTKITTFETALAEYKLVVSDLGEMECVESPDLFKASLEAARDARQQVKQAADEIKAFLQASIKPTLQQIRTQLSGNSTEPAGQDESGNNSQDNTPNEGSAEEGGL